jgi:LPS export ABC transporter protein LptC
MSILFMIMPCLWVLVSQYSHDKIIKHFIQTIGTQPINLSFETLTVKTIRDTQKSVNVTAPTARIYDLKISKIDLNNPLVTLSQKNHSDSVLTSDIGVYQQDKYTVTLSDNVKLSQDGVYKVKTDKLLVDLNNFAITLPNGVNALYKNNSLKANDVEFQQKSNKAIFKGGVKVVIQPNTL